MTCQVPDVVQSPRALPVSSWKYPVFSPLPPARIYCSDILTTLSTLLTAHPTGADCATCWKAQDQLRPYLQAGSNGK